MASKKNPIMEKQRDNVISPSPSGQQPQLATLRRPVAVVKKRSGPLDGVLDELNQMEGQATVAKREDLLSTVASPPEEHACAIRQPTASSSTSKAVGRVLSTTSGRRRCSTKEKDKKRERWLLTRKTWRYMTDAGRKLIPDGVTHGADDISQIEAQFQRVCASEPRFILWRRKASYPGAGAAKSSRRRLKLLSRHSSQSQNAQRTTQEENADQIIELLQSYLKIRDAYKTTALLGTKTVRPDQTASPSSQRPLGSSRSGKSLAGSSKSTASAQSIEQLGEAEILARLKILSQSSMLGGLSIPVESITPTILEDKALLKKIYNTLKKQQLHRILSVHSTQPPKGKFNLSRAASLSSLFNYSGYENTSPKTPTSKVDQTKNAYRPDSTKSPVTVNVVPETPKRTRKPPNTLNLSSTSPKSNLLPPKRHPHVEKSYNSCGTQTNFIQLSELKRLAEIYKEQKQEELMFENGNNNSAASEEESDRHGGHAHSHGHGPSTANRRKSSIDNEDVSQSVSDTIKRYLRMARKKSVHDADANRFKRVNYDRNLRNIKAKGEINPPGMDEDFNKAVQTLDAWPLIALDYIRGNESSRTLENAHIDWQKALDERIRKKLEWEKSIGAGRSETDAGHPNPNVPTSTSNAPTVCTSAPTSPTNADHYGKERSGRGASGLLTSGSQFLSNFWHANQSQSSSNQYGKNGNISEAHLSPKNETTNMQKSKSLSNVGQFVSRKIWRSRSKSQNRPNYDQHFASIHSQKWSPTDNCTWVSDHGDKFQITDTSLEKLSETEAKLLMHIAVEKIKELNIAVNIDFDRKSQKRRIIPKKKAITTSFFDIGKKDDHNGRDNLFGSTLESCLSRDRKREVDLPGSKHSLMSVFRNSVAGSAGATKLNDNVRSCESLPSKTLESGSNGSSERSSFAGYFTNLKKSSSMQISRSQSDMRHDELELGYNNSSDAAIDAESKVTSELNVPAFIMCCLAYLEEHGLQKVGLFRVSTSKKRVKQLRDDFDKSLNISIPNNTCPHDVATLLKEFLRDLPEPLLCKNLYTSFLETQRIRNRRLQLEGISHLVKLLPIAHRDTLYVLLKFLAKVAAHSDDIRASDGTVHMNGNKMDSSNLATVFAPNVLRDAAIKTAENREHEYMSDAINVIRTMIDHYEEIFKVPGEIIDVVYSQMLDECPEKLYALISSKVNVTECCEAANPCPTHMHLAESAMNQPDTFSSSDEVFESPKETIRYGILGPGSSEKGLPYDFKDLCEERRQSTPILLDNCTSNNMNVFSASLQISIPEQSSSKSTKRGGLQEREIASSKVSEPRLPTSISNIGGATLSAKTAEFERNANKDMISPNTSQGQTVRRKPLYKRQQLIPSSKRIN
ncbi:uncharacterized protein LOC115627815 [Scaptodrosophila lebanonensis]|uniref:Uncharacterized protein LOC115627815 n=1 Tax=Drosophila lebanonensis TaxID=7225 RepID=A0A6J2TSA5_DROLE|nr:uncharacterized protein LOC115627815 [Scaptodrosophila lebanonensis]